MAQARVEQVTRLVFWDKNWGTSNRYEGGRIYYIGVVHNMNNEYVFYLIDQKVVQAMLGRRSRRFLVFFADLKLDPQTNNLIQLTCWVLLIHRAQRELVDAPAGQLYRVYVG
jgi:hypothetical protein